MKADTWWTALYFLWDKGILPQTLSQLNTAADAYVKLRTSKLAKTQPSNSTHTNTISHTLTHTQHTASWAGRSDRKAAECCRLRRNVILDQVIRFIFTWLQAKRARRSRRLDLTVFGRCAFKKGKNNWFKQDFILRSRSHLLFCCNWRAEQTHTVSLTYKS